MVQQNKQVLGGEPTDNGVNKNMHEIQHRFIFEEKDENNDDIKYYGKDSTKYSADRQSKRKVAGTNTISNNEGQFSISRAENGHEQDAPNFQSANYALMIFDKKKSAFRLVPI